MKTWVKVFWALGAALMIAGIAFIASVPLIHGFDFKWELPSEWKGNTYSYDVGAITGISVLDIGANVQIQASPLTEAVTVSCLETEKQYYDIRVDENGTLSVIFRDDRAWYEQIELGLDPAKWNRTLLISLPANLAECRIKTVSGSIDIFGVDSASSVVLASTSGSILCGGITCTGDISVQSVSGDISLTTMSGQNLSVGTTSGSVMLEGLSAEQDFSAETTSGEVSLMFVTCKNLKVQTVSGDLNLFCVSAEEALRVSATSGDVAVDTVLAPFVSLKTVSGDVEGTVYGDPTTHVFRTSTVSGDVRVSDSLSSSTCEYETSVATTSGDISLRLTDYFPMREQK